MKKLFSVLVLTGLCMVNACGSLWDSPTFILPLYITAVEELDNDVQKAINAEDFIASLESFSSKMKYLEPKMKALNKEQPGLMAGDETPEDLKEIRKKFTEIEPIFKRVRMKMKKFNSDPRVAEVFSKNLEYQSFVKYYQAKRN